MGFKGKKPVTMTRFQFEKQIGGEFVKVPNSNSVRSNGKVSTWVDWSKERQEQKAKFILLENGKKAEGKTWKELHDRIQAIR